TKSGLVPQWQLRRIDPADTAAWLPGPGRWSHPPTGAFGIRRSAEPDPPCQPRVLLSVPSLSRRFPNVDGSVFTWAWLAAGILLLASELFAPSLTAVFFGIS